MHRLVAIGLVCSAACFAATAQAVAGDIPAAYRNIARAAGVPETLLYAIALQESNLQVGEITAPWPWTLNIDGVPLRFANRAQMAEAIRSAQQDGARYIDVGAMQINLHFNGHRFETHADLLDPYTNIRIAAEILRDEHAACGNWWCAIGRYHSRTPERADHYREGVKRWLSQVDG